MWAERNSFIGLDGVDLECHHLSVSDTSTLAVGPKGRVVIPVEIRRQLGLEEGSQLVAVVEGDGVLLLPRDAVKRRLRGMFAGVEGSMADELIRDRRAAAAEESREE
jgi:AbrB family looped-hinge helix DNA binding protein